MTAAIATADCYDALIEAFRARKALLGLSDATVDELGGLASGHTNQILGPSRNKSLSPMTIDVLMAVLAIKLHVVEDIEAAKVMEGRWEKRVESHVRRNSERVSKKIIERAKPAVLKACGALGGKRRAEVLSASHLTKIGRKGARIRWMNERKKRREAKMVPGMVV